MLIQRGQWLPVKVFRLSVRPSGRQWFRIKVEFPSRCAAEKLAANLASRNPKWLPMEADIVQEFA